MAIDGMGNVYIADPESQRVRKINNLGIISTFAGGGFSGVTNGSAATNIQLFSPTGVATDAAGNVYIADEEYGKVFIVNSAGIINLFAGSSISGFNGDGGQATNAQLSYPRDVAVDATGNVYIADVENYRIRKVNTSGIITTVAGNGFSGYSGDGGQATNAGLYSPLSVAVDGVGNIYIVDYFDNVVRKINTSGIISTIAGNGFSGFMGDGGQATNASLNEPVAVATDAMGNVYISDGLNNRVREVNTSGIITTVAGNGTPSYSGDGGQATAAELYQPDGIAIGNFGEAYIVDNANHRVRKMSSIAGASRVCIGASFTYTNYMPGGVWSSSNSTIATIGTTTGTITGLQMGFDTIIYTIGGNSLKQLVHVDTPWAGTITGTNSFCITQPDTLYNTVVPGGTWSAANGFAWIDASGIITPITSGLEVIDYSVTNACGSYSALYPINIIPIPPTGTITGDDSLCVGHPALLTESVSGGTWGVSGTVATVSATGLVTAVAPGLGIIYYTVTNQCGTATKYYAIDVLTATQCLTYNAVANVNRVDDELKIFPNPSTGKLILNYISGNNETISYTITNLLGEEVKHFTAITNVELEVNTNLSAGVYFITASTEHSKQVSKIVIY